MTSNRTPMSIMTSVAMEENQEHIQDLKKSREQQQAIEKVHDNCTETLQYLTKLYFKLWALLALVCVTVAGSTIYQWSIQFEPIFSNLILLAILLAGYWEYKSGHRKQLAMIDNMSDITTCTVRKMVTLIAETEDQLTFLQRKDRNLSWLLAAWFVSTLAITLFIVFPIKDYLT